MKLITGLIKKQKRPTGKEIKKTVVSGIDHGDKVSKGLNGHAGRKNLIITIISNKGGAGKTSITLAASLFFSRRSGGRTLLLELDSSPGDFGILFDIEKDKSLELALKFPNNYKKYVKNISRDLDVLKGISNPLTAESIDSASVKHFMKKICRDYDFIIIDTQSVINGTILDVLRLSNIIFVVSEYTPESTARIKSLVDILIERFDISRSKIRLVINKKKIFPYFRIWDLSKIINIPVDSFISFDKKFYKNLFLFNRNKVIRTRFFKDVSRMLGKLC